MVDLSSLGELTSRRSVTELWKGAGGGMTTHAILFGANGIISFGANLNVIWMWCDVGQLMVDVMSM